MGTAQGDIRELIECLVSAAAPGPELVDRYYTLCIPFYREFLGGEVRTLDYIWVRNVRVGAATGCHFDWVYMGRGTRNLYTTWIPIGDVPLAEGPLAGERRLSIRTDLFVAVLAVHLAIQTAFTVVAGDSTVVRWWLIQTRGRDGAWTTNLRPAGEGRLGAAALGTADPDEIAITAISPTGMASEPTIITP